MIDELTMSFRHLREIAMRDLSGVNIIVGPNNAGKTSIFRGIQAMTSDSNLSENDKLGLGSRLNLDGDVKRGLSHADLLYILYPPRHSDSTSDSPVCWWRNRREPSERHYMSTASDSKQPLALRLTGSSILFCSLETSSNTHLSRWREVEDSWWAPRLQRAAQPLAQQNENWLANTYFLWHRRKSRYDETLGAFHGRLDEEAEHLAGRLDHLLAGPGGGAIRAKIDRFMNAVVPNIGSIGIDRRKSKSDEATLISVVFSNGSRQIFIATHSPVFVNEFPGANVYRVSRGPDGDAAVHGCVDRASQRQVLARHHAGLPAQLHDL